MEQFQRSIYWYGTEKHFLELEKKTKNILTAASILTLNLLFFNLPFRADDRQEGLREIL